MIILKYGAHSGCASAHATLLSEVTADDPAGLPSLEDGTDEYDDIEVSVLFSYVAFSSSLTPGRDFSQFWVVASACSINLTAFRGDFVNPPPLPLAWVGSVSTLRAVAMCGLASGQRIHRTIPAMYIPDMSSRSAQRIGMLLSVIWMQSHSGCEFVFPTDSDTGLLEVPT
jgi:hypothetical protein